MRIGKKIYFDKTTGNVVLDKGEMQGSVRETTQAEDFASYVELAQRVPETVGVIQLEYGQYAQDFRECNGYRINPDTLTVEFSYPDPNLPPEEQPIVYQKPLSEEVADLKQSIAELTIMMATPTA